MDNRLALIWVTYMITNKILDRIIDKILDRITDKILDRIIDKILDRITDKKFEVLEKINLYTKILYIITLTEIIKTKK